MTRLVVAVWDNLPVTLQVRIYDLAPGLGRWLDEQAWRVDRWGRR